MPSSIAVFALFTVPRSALHAAGLEFAALARRAIVCLIRMILAPARVLPPPQDEVGADSNCRKVMAPTDGSTSGNTELTTVFWSNVSGVHDPLVMNCGWFL